MSDNAFLDRHGQATLRDTLHSIEAHLDDLADTITRQASTARKNVNSHRRPKKLRSRPPVDEGAQDVANSLHNSLHTAVRHTCEYRAVAFIPVGFTHRHGEFIGPLLPGENRVPPGYDESTLAVLVKWLRKHLISFAMTEGSPEWADSIEVAAKRLMKVIDLPPDDYVHIDYSRVAQANHQLVTTGTVEVVARRLGDMGKGLNARRVRTLVERGKLKPNGVPAEDGTQFYRLGDVLDAHHRHARRKKAS
ncbi:hypothetical protein [Gordonia tangerina]|uniref:Uncharacterized protein n=1 Tax=Gordonia tangerina TaxID=2911060 RepID=A0ABS9DLE9_9ACTN|nr:hypothetical protein [Gordonia tangerina]MCF3939913.1 hypothetical protein [Gordonia tangerina]